MICFLHGKINEPILILKQDKHGLSYAASIHEHRERNTCTLRTQYIHKENITFEHAYQCN